MKNQPDLTLLTDEALNNKLKTTKLVAGMLLGIIIVQFIIGIYLTVKQGFNVFIVIPITFLPICIINFSSIKKMNEEIARRKN